MKEQWQELKETITEMRDNDGTSTQQEVCKFLVDYMEILEKQILETENKRLTDILAEQSKNLDSKNLYIEELEAENARLKKCIDEIKDYLTDSTVTWRDISDDIITKIMIENGFMREIGGKE